MFKILWISDEFEGIKNPLKIDDIFRNLAGVDDDLMFLTGAGVFDDILDGLKKRPEGVMFKIWLKSDEFEGQEPCQRLMTFQEFLLELMMILTFLTGAGVLDDIMDCLQMP